MDRRKLVKSGNTSFTITLPIDWIRKNGLDSGSMVGVEERDNGDIILTAQTRKETSNLARPKQNTILVDKKSSSAVELEIILEYIRDTPAIVIKGKDLASHTQTIAKVIQDLIGFEIIEQTPDLILIKNFFRLDDETSPTNMVNKLVQINRVIFSELSEFFTHGYTEQNVFETRQLRDQSKRLSYVAEKGILLATEKPEKLKQIRSNRLELYKHKTYVSANRRIATYLVRIAELFSLLNNTEEGIEAFAEIYKKIQETYATLSTSIVRRDIKEIQKLLIETRSIEKEAEQLFSQFEDPILLQANTVLFALNQEIWELAYESLL